MKIAALLLCLMPLGVLNAHLPHIVNQMPVYVANPEISQAFYASQPGTFIVKEQAPFTLFVQVLRPYARSVDYNIRVAIDHEDKTVAMLDGSHGNWKFFHEPFGNDDYYQGPEITMKAQGLYSIHVEGAGKYILVIGKKEYWSVYDIIRTVYTLPFLKIYFGKSPLTAYWNLSGAFLLVLLILCAGLVYGGYRFIQKIRRP